MPNRDLFGNPISPTYGRPGRPRFMPKRADRRLVRKLRRAGATQAEIAAQLGITIPTLALNFPAELESRTCRAARRAQRDRQLKKDMR